MIPAFFVLALAAASVSLEVATEEGREVVIATVTRDGTPAEGAVVSFGVVRTFGTLDLGHDETLDDGTAAVPFPAGLPAGRTGKTGTVRLVAKVTAPPDLAGAEASLDVVSKVPPPEADPFPRALWSPRAPVPLILVFVLLLGGVWSTYLFIALDLLHIRKKGSP